MPATAQVRASLDTSRVPRLEPLTDWESWIGGDLRRSTVGLLDNGVPLAAVRDATDGATILAAIKVVDDGGPLEVFHSQVAAAMGADDIVVQARRLPDGSAAIPFVPGDTPGELGVYDADELFEWLAARRGRDTAIDDLTRMVAFDAVIGNRDRNPGNVILDDWMRLIDHPFVTQDASERRAPRLLGTFVANVRASGTIESPLPIARVDDHFELPISEALARDLRGVTSRQLEAPFAQALRDAAGVEGRYSLATDHLDDVVRRASWIADNLRIPFRL